MGQIQAWLYSNATDTTVHSAHNEITVTEPGPTTATVRLAEPKVFADALTSWASLLTASALAGTYSLTYSATTQRVTVSATGVASFTLTLPTETAQYLGMTAGGYTGAATYTGNTAPAAVVEAPIYSAVAESGNRVEVDRHRLGRPLVYAWGASDFATIRLSPEFTDADRLLSGPCSTGRIRVYQCSDTSAYSSLNPDGYLDGFVLSVQKVQVADADTGAAVAVELRMVLPRSAAAATTGATLWDTLRYGWGVNYWLTVEGVTTVFLERQTSLSLPTGYTDQDASLSIDASPEVGQEIDRLSGIGAGMPLVWHLRDSTAVRSWLRSPSRTARLTSNLTATGLTVAVDDVSSWPASGSFYLGAERIDYASKTGATQLNITGAAQRGIVGYAYAHKANGVGNMLTDLPRWWRGREVTLWASPVTPLGAMTGANLAAEAVQVFRGHVSAGPRRDGPRWQFEALSLDRRLALPLVQEITGKVLGTGARYAVKKASKFTLTIQGFSAAYVSQWGPHKIVVQPFASDSDGDMLTGDEMRQRIVSAFAIARAAEGADPDLGAWVWHKTGAGAYAARVTVLTNANVDVIEHTLNLFGFGNQLYYEDPQMPVPINVLVANFAYILGWYTGDNPMWQVDPKTQQEGVSGIVVKLDSGDASLVPATGKVKVGDAVYSYKQATTMEGAAYLADLKPLTPDPKATAADLVGKTATIIFEDSGSLHDTLLRALHSSGTSALRDAAYDTLEEGQGYGFATDQVDQGAFGVVKAGKLSGVQVAVSSSGKSLADIFGGALALTARAITVRPDTADDELRLAAVHTSHAGSDWQDEITDAHLLTASGDPVDFSDTRDAPNIVEIEVQAAGDADADRIVFRDAAAAAAQGAREVSLSLPPMSTATALELATAGVPALFAAAQTIGAVEIRCVPWVAGEVGDVVRLDLTHYSLWQWSTGTPGLTGNARILGKRRNLRTGAVTLQLLVDGATRSSSLSPAARVSTFAGPAGAPTSIDIPIGYLLHFAKAISEAGGAVKVLHYQPGQVETTSEGYTVSAATLVGGVCRLTVASIIGAPTLSTANRSTLTLPLSGDALITTYQAGFAHGLDGTYWG